MPLHKSIPLCNFYYVGETLSSAHFKYKPVSNITKSETRLLYSYEVNNVEKTHSSHHLYSEEADIEKNSPQKLLQDKNKLIIIVESIGLKNDSINSFDKNKIYSIVENSNTLIIKNKDFNLANISFISLIKNKDNYLETPKQEMVKLFNKELFSQIKNITIEYSHELSNAMVNQINQNNSIELKCDRPLQLDYAYNPFELQEDDKLINIPNNYSLILNNVKDVEKGIFSKLLDINHIRDINYGIKNHQLYRNNSSLISKEKENSYLYRYDNFQLDYNKNPYNLYRLRAPTELFLYDNKTVYRIAENLIDKEKKCDDLERLAISDIYKEKGVKEFYRKVLFNVFKGENKYLDRLGFCHIFKDISSHPVDIQQLIPIFKSKEDYCFREYTTKVMKPEYFGLLKLSIYPLFNYRNLYVNRPDSIPAYKTNNNKNISVIKRWWWLYSTYPEDRLIVPNRDYLKMVDLLSNEHFEYLRYSYHPIEWGNDWGKDWNIPPAPISIDIMLDVINIIIMTWHKGVQGWLCCSGKESIQFLMELIYDWYTMNTSSPNSDYYRVFRWVRWEAEKVYFLDTVNGLQAIGIVVKNLLEYMKNHHFNVVPIWRNPKAMDSERSFNREPQNDDIIKDLDKLKGKRHYYIDGQNLGHKKIIRR